MKGTKTMAAAKMPFADLVFGKKAKGGEEPPEAEPENDAFTDYAIQAFPDLEGSPERLDALKLAIKACVKSDYGGKVPA